MSISQSLDISSDFRELARIRGFLQEFCNAHAGDGFDEEDMAQLELAVNEAAANIIEHAYHGEAGHVIQVVVKSENMSITVELMHNGEAFTPETTPPPSFDGSRSNGFGVFLIDNCMDEVTYRKNDDGQNSIFMVKRYQKK